MRVFVTGAAGFIGSNFCRRVRELRPDWRLIAYDALTYAGNLANLEDVLDGDACRFVRGDICDAETVAAALDGGVDAIVNFAAESHVDRSIHGSAAFVRTNVQGTQVLLEAARRTGVARFVQVSTDEVYGSLGPSGRFTEESPLAPNSPYSASKAGGDLLVRAYHETHGLSTVITRCSNNYGPYQFPEKVIPLFVTNLMEGRRVPLYGDGLNVRDWIHVRDHCDAVLAALERGAAGGVYNIGADCELSNIELTRAILRELGRDESWIERVKDRLGHDRRYAIDATRCRTELGWAPTIAFPDGLRETIRWYREHESWWRAIRTGEYLRYYEMQYGGA
ncbi:MAG: dTDP-glucose 4,6-dehydratase [Planctomycetota bacterium]|nr:MAG: dTDP-glucose 4,6-dehydratase [Planctomycetota bacterium]